MTKSWYKMFRVGRLRIFLKRNGSTVKWFTVSVGVETGWLGAWKKKIRKAAKT